MEKRIPWVVFQKNVNKSISPSIYFSKPIYNLFTIPYRMFIVESPFKYPFHFPTSGQLKSSLSKYHSQPKDGFYETSTAREQIATNNGFCLWQQLVLTALHDQWVLEFTPPYFFFSSSANLTAKVQVRNKIPYSEFPFRTSSLLLHRAKQLSCMMKVSLANVSGSHLKREFTILAISLFFPETFH